jgi:hypothetical protein
MDSTTPRRTTVALTAIALLALPTTAAASEGKDYSKNAATSAYEHGPLPPSGPAKDYDKNAATGAYTAAEPQDEEIYVNPSTGSASGQKNYGKNGATGDYAPAETPSVVTAAAQPDLRSPDARDAARAAQERQTQPRQDLRSPDASDAANGRGTFSAPDVTVVKLTEPSPPSAGLDWGDAGIGAGGMLGVILLALGSTLAVTHRRQSGTGRQTATTG